MTYWQELCHASCPFWNGPPIRKIKIHILVFFTALLNKNTRSRNLWKKQNSLSLDRLLMHVFLFYFGVFYGPMGFKMCPYFRIKHRWTNKDYFVNAKRIKIYVFFEILSWKSYFASSNIKNSNKPKFEFQSVNRYFKKCQHMCQIETLFFAAAVYCFTSDLRVNCPDFWLRGPSRSI